MESNCCCFACWLGAAYYHLLASPPLFIAPLLFSLPPSPSLTHWHLQLFNNSSLLPSANLLSNSATFAFRSLAIVTNLLCLCLDFQFCEKIRFYLPFLAEVFFVCF